MKCAPTKCSIERVLVGIDGSENSLRAARLAGEMAITFGAHVTLVHVDSALDPSHDTTESDISCDDEETGKNVLCAAIEVMKELRVLYDTKVVAGHPAEMIMKLAEEEGDMGFDLIVLGSCGTSPRERLLSGSVSQKVSHNSKVPVLVVP